jgi:HAD superfamily hydrolase (TIGR01457 family)
MKTMRGIKKNLGEKNLEGKNLFVLDMDGTFYLGDRLLEGSLEFIQKIGDKGMDFIFFTNNSSKNARVYVEKLARLGCLVTDDKIVTSGMVTLDYLERNCKGNDNAPKVYLLGTPALVDEFERSGVVLTDETPDVMVAGFDTTVNYEKLTKACDFVRHGVPFVATHPDFNCPVEGGFIPDCGAICAFITASTGVRPKIIGKPHTETLEYLLRRLGKKKEELVFVGDRLYTDIAIGVNHGVSNVLVLTGETQSEDLAASDIQPEFVVNRLVDVLDLIGS